MSIYKMRTEFGHYAKPILYAIALVFFIGAVFSFGPANFMRKKGGEGAGDIIAKVNGEPITREEFDNKFDSIAKNARDYGIQSALQFADLRSRIITQMIQNRITLQVAAQMGVDISDAKVEEEVEKYLVQQLKTTRQNLLGKLTKEQEKLDPREDDAFIDALKKAGTSIEQQEELIRSQIPVDELRAYIASDGIRKAIKAKVGKVTDADIKKSYDEYQIRMIMLVKGTKPDAQLRAKAERYLKEIKSGANVDALIKDDKDVIGRENGGKAKFSFESRMFYPREVAEAIEKLKPGEWSEVIDAPGAFYVIKVESKTNKMPKKLSKKDRKQRIDMIKQEKENALTAEFSKKLQDMRKVTVLDPELLGYWLLYESMMAGGSLDQQQKKINLAISAFKKALKQRNNLYASAKLAEVYAKQNKVSEAFEILYPMLEGETVATEGADLRVLLGELFLKKGDKEKALQQFKIAGEMARDDSNIHARLLENYEKMKREDLAAIERKWLDDYQKKQAAQSMQNLPVKAAPAKNSSNEKSKNQKQAPATKPGR